MSRKALSIILLFTLLMSLASCKKQSESSDPVSEIDSSFGVDESTTDTTAPTTEETMSDTTTEEETTTTTTTTATTTTATTTTTTTTATTTTATTATTTTTTTTMTTTTATTTTVPTTTACQHKYADATCEQAAVCEKCKAVKGEKLGHDYKKGVCTRCEKKDPDYKYEAYVNGVGYDVGDVLEVNIILTTKDKDLHVCPCFRIGGDYCLDNTGLDFVSRPESEEERSYFEPTLKSSKGSGDIDDDGSFFSWSWMSALDPTTGVYCDLDFSKGQIIRRIKLTIEKPGTYTVTVTDGHDAEQNNNKYTDCLSLDIVKL